MLAASTPGWTESSLVLHPSRVSVEARAAHRLRWCERTRIFCTQQVPARTECDDAELSPRFPKEAFGSDEVCVPGAKQDMFPD